MEENGDWLESMLALQETDNRLDRMREQVESAPRQKKEAQDNLDREQQGAVDAREEVRKKELEISNVNSEIQSFEQQKLKILEQSNSIKDNQTYKTLMDEIESLDRRISDKEDVVLELMEELDSLKAVFKDAQGRLKEAVSRVEQMMSDLDVRIKNCQEQIVVLEEKRNEQALNVDEELLFKYERIKNSHGKARSPLVEINSDQCGHCHLKLTTQEILSAKKHTPFTACSNCGSLLYS